MDWFFWEDIKEEEINVANDINGTIVTENPLMNFMSNDDPFEDEFDNYFISNT